MPSLADPASRSVDQAADHTEGDPEEVGPPQSRLPHLAWQGQVTLTQSCGLTAQPTSLAIRTVRAFALI
jgi:hypothetical protein